MRNSTTEFHKIRIFWRVTRPSVLGVMAAQVQGSVHSHTVGHECPIFSKQTYDCFGSNTQRTGIKLGNNSADFHTASETCEF